MDARIVRSLDELRGLESTWSALPTDSPFSSWSFLIEWFTRHAGEAEPFVVVVSDGSSAPALLAPWCISQVGGCRRLTGAGTLDAAYHDPLVRNAGLKASATRFLIDHVRRTRPTWDMIDLTLRERESSSLLAESPRLGWPFKLRVGWRQHAIIEFREGWPVYWGTHREHFEGAMRRARKLERMEHRYVRADASTLDTMLDALFRLHHARLGAERDWQAFYDLMRGVGRRALARSEVYLFALEIEGRYAALDLTLRAGEMCFGALRAYDPAYSNLGVGTLLTLWELEQLCAEGVRWVDCGPGLYEWKQRFATGSLPTLQLQVPFTPRGLARLEWREILRDWSELYPALSTVAKELKHGLEPRLAALRAQPAPTPPSVTR